MSRLTFSFGLLIGLAISALPAFAAQPAHEDAHEHAPAVARASTAELFVAPRQVVAEVNGVVCSFCAQGVARALRKLPGLDASQYKDGVRVEIEQQRVTLAFQEGVALPLREIHERIRKGGYETRSLHLQRAGALSAARAGEMERAFESADGRRFALSARDASAFALPGDATQVALQLVVTPGALATPGATPARIERVLRAGAQDE